MPRTNTRPCGRQGAIESQDQIGSVQSSPKEARSLLRGRPRSEKLGKASVIIPVFNQASLTAQCLRSLLKQRSGQIIVVDDASTDSTPQILAGCARLVKSVVHETNAGFAQSCNDGARVASGDYLVFLNNDTIPQSGWLGRMINYAEAHSEAAAVGAKLLYPNDTVQHAGVVVCQDRYPRHIYAGFPADHPAVNKSRPFQIVTAACLLVRREIFEEVGGFDTAFHNGFEDVDLCLRLRERGHQVHYCAESVLYHLESASPGRFIRDRENIALYRQRWQARVRPDDLEYYLEDGLLRVSYEGRYPICMQVSPSLAAMDGAVRTGSLERQLREYSREIADLQRENVRLGIALGEQATMSRALEYRRLRERVYAAAKRLIPRGSTVLVISKGDGLLLQLPRCLGWHFPQSERGVYSGHHPATSEEAISQLEALRARGGGYLLIPASSRWWLEYYTDFRRYLENRYLLLRGNDDSCTIYCLRDSRRSESHHGVAKVTA